MFTGNTRQAKRAIARNGAPANAISDANQLPAGNISMTANGSAQLPISRAPKLSLIVDGEAIGECYAQSPNVCKPPQTGPSPGLLWARPVPD